MTLMRVEIISRAKQRAGPTTFSLNLVSAFDEVLVDITGRFPILKNNILTGNTTKSQAYLTVTFPPGYRIDHGNEQMFCDDLNLIWMEPEEYFYLRETDDTDVPSRPSRYTVDITNSKIYLRPTPNDVYVYSFYYTKYHPESTNDSYTHLLGNGFDDTLIYGVTYKACELSNPPQIEKSLFWKDKYESDLILKTIKRVSKKPSSRSNFWQSNW